MGDTDAGRMGPRTPKGSVRSARRIPWLRSGEKSKASQQQVKAVHWRHRESTGTDAVSGRLRKERRESHLCLESGGLCWGLWSSACVPSGIKEPVRTKMRTQVLFLGASKPWCWAVQRHALGYAFNSFVLTWSFFRCHPPVHKNHNSLSLTRRTCTICILRPV